MKTDRQKITKKLDVLFSKKVREKGFCERCSKTENLQCAHIYSRKHKWLRWESENALCLCAGCHMFWWHLEPAQAIRWAMGIRDFRKLDELMKTDKPMKQFHLEEILETF